MVDLRITIYDDKDNILAIANTSSICLKKSQLTSIPLLTIAIPTYKRADLLRHALDSAIKQENIDDYEILVVDNNPERYDETEKLLKEYDNVPFLEYYKNSENLGMAGNWNKLYLLSRTKWVCMLHDDDMLYPDYLFCILKVIKQMPADAAGFYAFYNNITNSSNIQPKRKNTRLKCYKLKETYFLTGCIVAAPLGMCLKREIVLRIGGFNSDYYPSLDFHFHVKLSHFYTIYRLEGYELATYRWLVNAGKQQETLSGWLIKDSAIKRMILKNNGLCVFYGLYERYLNVFNYCFAKNWHSKYGNEESFIMPEYTFYDYINYCFVKFFIATNKRIKKIHIIDK
jgi:glycosyltransferase involved in cell wall biosynthesis